MGSGNTLARRLSFLFFIILITANLILLSVDLAKTNVHSIDSTQPASLSDDLQTLAKSAHVATAEFAHVSRPVKKVAEKGPLTYGRTIGHDFGNLGNAVQNGAGHVSHTVSSSLHTAGQTVGRIPKFVATATNVNTYIKPADYADVPVIRPLPTPKIIATVPAPAAPVVKPAAPLSVQQPTHTIRTAIKASPLPFSTRNTYAWGNCTWWAAEKRAQVSDPIPNSWGNAATWAVRAAGDGYVVDHHPSPGAIMQTPDSAGGLGHVAFVESVDQDGTWHISEMNVLGLDVVDHKAEPASAAADYHFIHDRI